MSFEPGARRMAEASALLGFRAEGQGFRRRPGDRKTGGSIASMREEARLLITPTRTGEIRSVESWFVRSSREAAWVMRSSRETAWVSSTREAEGVAMKSGRRDKAEGLPGNAHD
jgi:hypothetical protein